MTTRTNSGIARGGPPLAIVKGPASATTTEQKLADNLLRVPSLFTNKMEHTPVRALSLVDSGATHSCVAAHLVHSLGISSQIRPITSTDTQTISPFSDEPSHQIPRLGTIKLHLLCAGKTIRHSFEVIATSVADAIIGMDLFSALGFSVSGLPTSFDDEKVGQEAADLADQFENEVRATRAPWALQDAVPGQALIESLIAKQIKVNTAIPITAEACSAFPSATMHLSLLVNSSFRHQYPWPAAANDAVAAQIAAWLESNVIEPGSARSHWNSPLLATGKKDASGRKTKWRLCMDTRHLNEQMSAQSLKDDHAQERMPHLHEALRRMHGFSIASSIDLSGAYNQLPIATEDRDKLTFTYNGKKFRWRRWPFGLKPATVRFQRIMESVLDGLDFVTIWVDDIVVFSNGSAEDHANKVNQVLQRLTEHKLRINPTKCHFGYSRILMLGHMLSGAERSIDPLKVTQTLEWVPPTSAKTMQRFLGFVNYVRDYVPLHSRLTRPLSKLANLPAKDRFQLAGKELHHFNALVEVINSAPVLSTPDPNLPMCVATDASQTGLGAVLYQEIPGQKKPNYIAFASASLDGAQRNYPATKRELLAIVFALSKFHDHLVGRHFDLFTDHKALTALFTKRNLSYVMANWLDVLLRYDFAVHHRPGVDMLLPDHLSRIYSELANATVRPDPSLQSITPAVLIAQSKIVAPPFKTSAEKIDNIVSAGRDKKFMSSTELLAQQPARPPPHLSIDEITAFPEQELALLIRERFLKETIKDPDKQRELLLRHHANGHFGAEALYRTVWHSGHYWPSLRRQCQDIVHQCNSCLSYNVGKSGFNPAQSLRTDDPWDHIAVDSIVKLPKSTNGYRYVIVVVDLATRFVICKPQKTMSMEETARSLYEVFTLFGPPKILQSDNGTEYVNQLVKQLCAAAGIEHRTVLPYNPRANGLAERFVSLVKTALKKKLDGCYAKWEEALPGITLALNTHELALTKTAPFTLLFGGRKANQWDDYSTAAISLFHSDDPDSEVARVEALTNRANAFNSSIRPGISTAANDRQLTNKNRLDRSRGHPSRHFPVDALVMVRNQDALSKADRPWEGPYLVSSRSKRSGAYHLRYLNGTPTNRALPPDQLKWVADTTVPITSGTGDIIDFSPDSKRGRVDKIIDHRVNEDLPNTYEYLVRWVSKTEDDSWVPAAHFDNPSSISDYWRLREKNSKPSTPTRKRKAPSSNSSPASTSSTPKKARKGKKR